MTQPDNNKIEPATTPASGATQPKGYDKNSKKEKKPKKNIKSGVSPLYIFISRIINPNKWSLRARFVYTTGGMLIFGVAATLFIISYTLNKSAEDAVQAQLNSFTHILNRMSSEANACLLDTTARMAALEDVITALKNDDRIALQKTVIPVMDRVRLATNTPAPHLQFFSLGSTPLFNTWSLQALGDEQRKGFYMITESQRELNTKTGVQVLPNGPTFTSVVPVLQNNTLVGSVEGTNTFANMYKAMKMSSEYGLAVLLDNSYLTILNRNSISGNFKDKLIVEDLGTTDMKAFAAFVSKNNIYPERLGQFFIQTVPLFSYHDIHIGELILFYDGTAIISASEYNINILIWMALIGLLLIYTSLYINVKRIRDFLERMKKVIIASYSNDFAERFASDTVHCLDVLNCPNKECPVYQDPTRVCYLETGDEAISPKWSNTCIFLNKYKTCKACPVHKMRHGDELMEMRHVVDTMMRLWSRFLDNVGKLLLEVLRADPGRVPSLDDVSHYLEQMAGLTVYSRDLQGVYNKDEVYSQLKYIFEEQFGLSYFNLLEVNASNNRMDPVINSDDLEESHRDVFINCELCRAKRVGEDVLSANNPILCPYFDINPATHVRCCLPMVMGGRVGAVFTFMTTRAEWGTKKEDLGILKKYLDETAPVLSSLRLLQVSKEQALRDPLTQCHNRRFLDEYLAQFEHLNQRTPRKVGFIMADLDHFKMVNDEFGHQAGDMILQQMASILRDNIRRSDMLIRYGGEEFLILLMEITREGMAEEVAEKLRLAVENAKLVLPSGGIIKKTISLGVSEFPGDADQLYRVIKYADVALYNAKDNGRNRVSRFDPEMWTDDDY